MNSIVVLFFIEHDKDAKAWCSTEVDSSAIHIPQHWGHCDQDCLSKVTLELYNDITKNWPFLISLTVGTFFP